MEQVTGLEPVISAWKANVLPLHYTCKTWERCRRAARLLSGCVLRRKNRSAGCISLPSASILRSGVHSKAGIVCRLWSGAGNGARTRHLSLGKAALYQMSYSRRMLSAAPKETLVRAKRLELIRLLAPEPKSGASANSATPANLTFETLVTRRRFELRTP